ncbi:MAG: hypothetical protein VW352_10820, partial [Gammaproteobacteria bacterium]
LDVPSPLKARTVLTFGAIRSFRPSDIASPLSRLRAVTRSPHYALLYNAGTLISQPSGSIFIRLWRHNK